MTEIFKNNILLNTLPKSGSVYLRTVLCDILKAEPSYISTSYALYGQIDLDKLVPFLESPGHRVVSQNHLDYSEVNTQILETHQQKMVLHLRDPRQALLSWIHHLDRITGEDITSIHVLGMIPRPPYNYFSKDLKGKIDWHIDHYLDPMVRWIEAWTDIHDSTDTIMITEFKELKEDLPGLIQRILDFYEINPGLYSIEGPEKTMEASHYRKGEANEWQDVFTAAQVERSTAKIPPKLINRFGWELGKKKRLISKIKNFLSAA